MKKSIEIMVKILIIALSLALISTVVLADDLLDPSKITGTSTAASNSVTDIANIILGIIQVIAVAVAVIMLTVLGIKYVSAAPEGKADTNKSAVVYVVGAVLLCGTAGILQLIKSFANSVSNAV